MIPSSDGTTWWSTGIVLTYLPSAHRHGDKTWPDWNAKCDYEDAGWVGDDDADTGRISTSGTLHTRYAVKDGDERSGLEAAIDAILADSERLGITLVGAVTGKPTLYYRGDGEDPDFPPPDGWRELLAEQAKRIGWRQ